MSDQEFRKLVDQTNAKVIDTMSSEDGKVTIYVLANRTFDVPEEGLGNFTTVFDRSYLKAVKDETLQLQEVLETLRSKDDGCPSLIRKEKEHLASIVQDAQVHKARLLYDEAYSLENFKEKGEISFLTRGLIDENCDHLLAEIKIVYPKPKNGDVKDLLESLQGDPLMIDIGYQKTGSNIKVKETRSRSRITLKKKDTSYVMQIDHPSYESLRHVDLPVDEAVEKEALSLIKGAMLGVIQDYYL